MLPGWKIILASTGVGCGGGGWRETLSWPCVTDMTGEGADNQELDTGWGMNQVVRVPKLGAKSLTTFGNLRKGAGLRDLSVPYQKLLGRVPKDDLR